MSMLKKWMSAQCSYEIQDDGSIITDGTVHNKITGTAMGGILGVSPFSTPFQMACSLLGLGREDIGDKPAVKAGKVLETTVIDFAKENWADVTFIPAKSLFEERTGDHDTWESDFEDTVFAGHVDGMAFGPDRAVCVLEVKTSSNLESWENGVPEYYQLQVGLYNRFMAQQDHAYVLLGIMNPEALRDPRSWVPSTENVALFRMDIDQQAMDEKLAQAKAWYDEYILNNRTPPYDPTNARDVELFNHLRGITVDLSFIQDDLDRIAELDAELDAVDKETKAIRDEREDLRNKVKDYMLSHNLILIESTTGGFKGVISESVRRSISADLLEKDGIDPEPYTVRSVSKSFSVKKNKEIKVE